jgi:predicted MPP superfamily phosphohydrolase
VEIALPGLDPGLDRLKIVHLSDPHLGWWNSEAEFQRTAAMIAGLDPDLLAVTGDIADHNPDYVNAFTRALDPVRPRLGRFAVIGNHDVYTGTEAVAARMEAGGFKMLRSECVNLKERGAALSVAGYDDSGKSWTSGDPAANKIPDAVKDCLPGQPLILLAHRPPRFHKIKNSPVSLVLSGHTHGGQLRLPGGGPGLADLTFPHNQGLYQEDGKSLYVTRGIGTVGWPFRLFCPAEITLIVLRAQPPSAAPDT